MNKAETKQARAEVRQLKKNLSARQKQSAREIKNHRDAIRATERGIVAIEREFSRFEKTTNDRLAILAGRLNS